MRSDDAATYRTKLLGILKEADRPLNVAEVMTRAGKKNVNQVRSQLNWLAGDGQVLKLPGAGNSFTYKLRRPVDRITTQDIVVREISASGLAQLLRSLAKTRWVPKTAKSSSAMPFAIRKLYNYAHDVATGGVHRQEDYDQVRLELKQYHDDLVSTLATIRGILDKPELWSSKDSAKWLLSSGGNSSEFNNLANESENTQR